LSGVEIKIDASELIKTLEAASKVMRPATLLGVIGAAHLNWIDDNFRRRGIERRWPALSPNTVAAKGSSAPLQDTGRLRQSFSTEVAGDEVRTGTVNQVASIHHSGTGGFTIRPRSASVLRFLTRDGVVYARRVDHPGIPARPLIPSKAVGEQVALDAANAAIEAVLDE
jgi:phage gpG-like protein